jgi:ectoine hydroxylase-related dioxygenase (phytanoyl-CoA dioxygenase family)
MLFVKSPGLPGQSWHQDEIYIPTRDRSLTGAWIAIDDATVENGTLWVIPKSHKKGYLYPQKENTNNEDFDYTQESYGFDSSEEIPVEVPAGSVVFFNGYLLHRSAKNRSQNYRRVLVNHYLNAYSLLPWNKEEGQSVANSDIRRIVPVAGIDPYAWKGVIGDGKDVSLRSYQK